MKAQWCHGLMEACKYKVKPFEQSWGSGYRLEGPGLQTERVFRGEESRERLEDIADLMNFAFEQGRRVVEADQRSALKMPGLEKEGGNLLRGVPRQTES